MFLIQRMTNSSFAARKVGNQSISRAMTGVDSKRQFSDS